MPVPRPIGGWWGLGAGASMSAQLCPQYGSARCGVAVGVRSDGAKSARSGNDVTLTGGSLSGVEVDCEDFPDGAVA